MIASELDLEKPLIFELPAVFTAAECDRWIKRIQSAGTELAPINTKSGSQVDNLIRNNRRVVMSIKLASGSRRIPTAPSYEVTRSGLGTRTWST